MLRLWRTDRAKNGKSPPPEWNKAQAPNAPEYRPYRVSENNGIYIIREHTALQIHDVFGDYEIRIPNYDMDAIRTMLDLPIRF